MRRLPSPAGLVFALLVLATVAAFAWSQRLKRDPLVIDRVTFGMAHRRAFVQVVKPGGKLVITLARDRFLKRYHFFTFYWDGRSRNDGIAPPGRYKLRVKLLDQGRTLVPPGTIRLHRAPRRPTPDCGSR